MRGAIFRREYDRSERTTPAAIWIFLIAWLVLESIGVAGQGRMYAYHFMVLAPPLALLFGACRASRGHFRLPRHWHRWRSFRFMELH